jgi:hypothetical protein
LKSKSKVSSEPIGIAKARQFMATFEQAVLSPQQLVGDEHRHQIDRRDLLKAITASVAESAGSATPRLQRLPPTLGSPACVQL